MGQVPKIWQQIAKLPKVKQPARKYDRAKRTKKQLIEFAESLGLEIKFDYYKRGQHSVWDSEDSINHNYGPQDWLCNLFEIEWCLEDYQAENQKS